MNLHTHLSLDFVRNGVLVSGRQYHYTPLHDLSVHALEEEAELIALK